MIEDSKLNRAQKVAEGSAKAYAAKKKYEQNKRLWRLASAAVESVDPEFAVRVLQLQCVAVCCGMQSHLASAAVESVAPEFAVRVLQSVAVCCSVLQYAVSISLCYC